MIRKGRFKLCYSHGGSVGASPDIELYDLETDPGEFKNLSGQIDYEDEESELLNNIFQRWGNIDALDRTIRKSQESRLLIRNVLGDNSIF